MVWDIDIHHRCFQNVIYLIYMIVLWKLMHIIQPQIQLIWTKTLQSIKKINSNEKKNYVLHSTLSRDFLLEIILNSQKKESSEISSIPVSFVVFIKSIRGTVLLLIFVIFLQSDNNRQVCWSRYSYLWYLARHRSWNIDADVPSII